MHAERALRVASLKSARYSIQQPLAIGAALAGADDAQQAALAAFGHPVGMAFQLRDDVLGVFGDEAVTGKPSGDDLREGKRTVLIAYARERLAPPARRIVDELVGDPGLDAAQIASLQQTIIDTGALERVEHLIAEYSREVSAALSGARLANAAVGELRDLARAATDAQPDEDRRGPRSAEGLSDATHFALATRAQGLDRRKADRFLRGQQPVDRLIVGEARVVQDEERSAQRADRLAVLDEDGRDGERPVSARADELKLVEQSTDTAQRFAEHFRQFGKSEPFGFDGRGVSGHEATISFLPRSSAPSIRQRRPHGSHQPQGPH